MKKAFKSAAIAALAISAITPVAASAATEDVSNGIYTTEGFYSIADFKKLSTTKKAALLTSPKAALVVNGQALPASIIVTGTDAQIDGSYISLAAYEQQYNVSFNSGTGFGETPQAGELKVESVSAINSTKLAVKFNKPVNKATAENLGNYYIGLTEDDVDSSSVTAYNGTDYKATLVDETTVIIEGATATNVIWTDKNTDVSATALKVDGAGATVVKGKTVFVQVRNVKDAAGKLMNTQEESFVATDATPSKLSGAKITRDATGTVTAVAGATITEHAVTAAVDTYFVFDEPIKDITTEQFYLDSRNITPYVSIDTTIDPSGKTLKVTAAAGLADLVVGEYTFEAVGVEDLAGNKVVGNVQTATLKVVDPTDAENTDVAPTVKSLVQTEEGKFVVTFASAPKDGTLIVVKDSEGNTVVSHATTGADATEEVTFASAIADYVSSTELLYTVEVTGATGGKIESATGDKKADKYKKVHSFKLDLAAPTVKYSTTSIDADGKEVVTKTAFVTPTAPAKIVIPFEDKLFNGGVELATAAPTQDIVIKQHVGDETKTLVIPFTDVDPLALNVMTLDIEALATAGSTAAEAFLNDAGDALLAGEYEITLPRGIVTDNLSKKLSTNKIPFAGDVVKFKVDGEEEGTTPSVPQTAQNLVTYDTDHRAITVEFKGSDIDAKTAKNPANYTLAGSVLDSDTVIEYETIKDATGTVTGGKARIFVKNDTIARDGNYTLAIKNVATNGGAKMLPTSVTVNAMDDNTLPVLTSAVITGNAKLELTFTESVAITSGEEAKAAANFLVTVNNEKYNAATATVHATNDKVIVLDLNDTIDYAGKTVKVTTKKDQNGDVFVTDLANNKLKVDVEKTATVKQ